MGRKYPKKLKRKAEEVIEKEVSMKKKQKKSTKEVEKKKTIKNQENTSDDDDVQVVPAAAVVKKGVLAAKKKDKIWDEDDPSSDEDVFEDKSSYSDTDTDVIPETISVLVYIRDGCYMHDHLVQVGEALRRHLSSCEGITGMTVYGHPMNLERKARITFATKQAAQNAVLKFNQSQLLDGTPITVQLQGDDDLCSDSSVGDW